MRPALLVTSALLATLVALVVSCGGSSSETPWPAEPAPALMGPAPEPAPLGASPEDDAGTRKR